MKRMLSEEEVMLMDIKCVMTAMAKRNNCSIVVANHIAQLVKN